MLLVSLLLSASAFGYEKEIDSLSSAMAAKIAGKGKKTVAVADFTDLQGNVTELGRFIAEELSGLLAEKEKGFEVVNRSNLNQFLQEHKLCFDVTNSLCSGDGTGCGEEHQDT